MTATTLALFDLDNTLLAGDSDFEWAQFLISRGILDRELYEAKNEEFYEQYKAGTLDIHVFLDFQLKPLSRHPKKELDSWHLDFMRDHITPIITEKGRARIRAHQDAGALVAIVTATNSFVTRPIAEALGVAHLVATEPEMKNGEFTGGVEGIPSFREGKIARVEMWLAGLGQRFDSFSESWFYSDSLNDLPLLEQVKHPVAVDPDPTLQRHAQAKGWTIETFR